MYLGVCVRVYLVVEHHGVFGRYKITMTEPFQVHVVEGTCGTKTRLCSYISNLILVIVSTFSNIEHAKPHRHSLRKTCWNRRPKSQEAGVVSYIGGIHLRRPNVVEVLGNHRTNHGSSPDHVPRLLLLGCAEYLPKETTINNP